jgi:predicted metal-dependent phosphoesterase TrpH
MSVTRRLAIALIGAGAILGSALDVREAPTPPAAGDYRVVTADFHVHSFLGDGALAPWEVRREARRRGLDAIVIANHNQVFAARLAAALASDAPIVLVAQEVTAPDFHMTAVGITRAVDWWAPASRVIEAIHAQGGVAIANHPVADSWRVQDDAALGLLDGTELAHPAADLLARGRGELTAFYERARRNNPDIAAIGSSDAHAGGLGDYRTFVLVEQVTARAILEAIRHGRTVAEDARGVLYGNPKWIAVVEPHRPPRPAGPGVAARLSGFAVLAGLALIVLFR